MRIQGMRELSVKWVRWGVDTSLILIFSHLFNRQAQLDTHIMFFRLVLKTGIFIDLNWFWGGVGLGSVYWLACRRVRKFECSRGQKFQTAQGQGRMLSGEHLNYFEGRNEALQLLERGSLGQVNIEHERQNGLGHK